MPKTALELTREEWKAYRIPPRVETPELKKRKEDAWQVARRAARILKEEFGIQHVILFGSLARNVGFHIESDIDLAVPGMESDRFFRAIGEINEINPKFRVDLIELSICPPKLSTRIHDEGVEL